MKKLFLLALVSAMASSAFAADLPKGTYEIKVGASYDLAESDDDSPIAIGGGLGYFAAENLLLGAQVAFEKKEWESYWGVSDVWALGAFGEYHFNNGSALIPFVGAAASILDGSDPDNDTVFVFSVSGGIKLFLTESITLAGEATYNMAGDDIYDFSRLEADAEDGEGESTGAAVAISLRFLL